MRFPVLRGDDGRGVTGALALVVGVESGSGARLSFVLRDVWVVSEQLALEDVASTNVAYKKVSRLKESVTLIRETVFLFVALFGTPQDGRQSYPNRAF
jgi:hypothetical protein